MGHQGESLILTVTRNIMKLLDILVFPDVRQFIRMQYMLSMEKRRKQCWGQPFLESRVGWPETHLFSFLVFF